MFRPCNVNLKLIGSVEKREGFFFSFSALYLYSTKTYCGSSLSQIYLSMWESEQTFFVNFLPWFAKIFLTEFWELSHGRKNAHQIACRLAITGWIRHSVVFLFLFCFTFSALLPRVMDTVQLGCCVWLQWQGIDLCLKKLCYFGHWKSLYNFVLYCFIWSIYSY